MYRKKSVAIRHKIRNLRNLNNISEEYETTATQIYKIYWKLISLKKFEVMKF